MTHSEEDQTLSLGGLTDSTGPFERVARTLPQIDGYKIVGVLGQGGMGIVYRAVQTKLNRAVALKVLPAMVGSANPSAVKRFRREATSAARLHHTNIVPIYDFGESRDAYYYAMELIAGAPLQHVLRSLQGSDVTTAPGPRVVEIIQNTLAPEPEPIVGVDTGEFATVPSVSTSGGRRHAYFRLVARWISDAADALHYAHSQGVIHRDIKPPNLILSHDGRVMIADFGLARTTEESSVTHTGSLLGTLRYVSPEQAMAKRVRVDHRTDIYSLGVTLYEALGLTPAFPGTDEKEILGAIIARDPTPLRKVQAAIPIELETICAKAIEKSPEARYQTARDMADDLRRYLHDEPIVARRPSTAARVGKFVRRRKAPAIAVTAVVLLVVASLIATRAVRSSRTAERQEQIAQVEKLVELGINAASRHHWDAAEAAFADAFKVLPNHVRALTGFIWMRIDRFKDEPSLATAENWRELDAVCARVLDIEPDNGWALNQRSIVLKNLGDYEEAIRVTERLIASNPDNFAAWSNLGAYQALAGKLDKAQESLSRGGDLAVPSNGRPEDRGVTYRNLAAVELHMGDRSAIEHIAAAIKENPHDTLVWVLRSRARLRLSDYRDAQEALNDAEYADRVSGEAHPLAKRMKAMARIELAESMRARGATEFMVEEYNRARRAAQEALDLGDRAVVVHLLLAISEAGRGNPIGAQDQIVLADANWPEALETFDYLASFDRGELWFESKAELTNLRQRAGEMIGAAREAALGFNPKK